jgi:hypothetical protein
VVIITLVVHARVGEVPKNGAKGPQPLDVEHHLPVPLKFYILRYESFGSQGAQLGLLLFALVSPGVNLVDDREISAICSLMNSVLLCCLRAGDDYCFPGAVVFCLGRGRGGGASSESECS